MTKKYSIRPLGIWLTIVVLIVVLVMLIRTFCVGSYHISTSSMEDALHKGDYVLVNKLPLSSNPGRNRVVLFRSPLPQDSLSQPLFISRCMGMPGDTIMVNREGYRINGKLTPRSPLTLNNYLVRQMNRQEFLAILEKLNIPVRELEQTASGFKLKLTAFEEYQLREEMSNSVELLSDSPIEAYSLVVPQKNRFYQLDATSLIACKQAILAETDGKAVFRDGKLYLEGKEASFFFFQNDYYWVLSDNPDESIDSRHLGFIPKAYMIGNVWFCWFSKDSQRFFKFVR